MNLIEEKFADVYVYNTFFYTKLLSSCHQGVQSWNKGVNIFSKRLLIFPVHLQVHWCKEQISYFGIYAIMAYLEQLSKSSGEWDGVHCKGMPMQSNSYDCGVFICMYACCLAEDSPFSFSQEDMSKGSIWH